MGTLRIDTPICFHCRMAGFVLIEATEEQADTYLKGALIQVAFPHVAADVREQIISGTHPDCWNEMFS